MSVFTGFKAFLRTSIENVYENVFGQPLVRDSVVEVTSTVPDYNLAQPKKINVHTTRGLYRNTLNGYHLAAHLAKPIIDANVNFIGKPKVRAGNKTTERVLNEMKRHAPFTQTHRIATRDGMCLVWPQWSLEKDRVEFVVVPPESIHATIVEPVQKEVIGYVFKEMVSYYPDERHAREQSMVRAEITVTVTKKYQEIEVKDDLKGRRTSSNANPFGFLPLVPFVHDEEPWENTGHSDLQNIEPMLRFYHEMTNEAGASQKRDGHPKAKVKTSNVKTWLENNFGTGTYESVLEGRAKISMQDRDLFLCKSDAEHEEDVQYIELNKTTGDYGVLSETTFTNIVEGSQTPEIIFGANLGTSLASVQEQRPVWIKKIQHLQEKFSLKWEEVFKVALQIQSFVDMRSYTGDIQLVWPVPDFATYKEKADTLNVVTNAFVKMKNARLMSDKEIHASMLELDNIFLYHNYNEHRREVAKTSEGIIETIGAEHEEKMERENRRINEEAGEEGTEPGEPNPSEPGAEED